MATKKTVDEPVVEEVETIEAPIVEPIDEAPVEAQVTPVETPNVGSIRAQAGDSYLSIAEKFATPGRAARELAKRIADANGNAPVRTNTRIILPTAN
jgi:hypothetical protein